MRQSTRRRREDGMAGLQWNREMISFGNIVLAMESRESVAALEQLAVFVLCILFNLLQAHWINSLDRSIQPLSMFFNLWLAGFGRHSSDPYSTVLAERGGENITFWRWCYLGLLDLWRMRSSCFAMSLFHFTSFVSGNGLSKSESKSWVLLPGFTFPVQISQRGIVLDRVGLHKLWVHRCKDGFHECREKKFFAVIWLIGQEHSRTQRKVHMKSGEMMSSARIWMLEWKGWVFVAFWV